MDSLPSEPPRNPCHSSTSEQVSSSRSRHPPFHVWDDRLCTYLFLALLDHHCRMQAYPSCSVWASHRGGLSCETQTLGCSGFSSCGMQAQELWHMGLLLWGKRHLPEPGIESMSPALAGGFLSTAVPGKSWDDKLLMGGGWGALSRLALPAIQVWWEERSFRHRPGWKLYLPTVYQDVPVGEFHSGPPQTGWTFVHQWLE